MNKHLAENLARIMSEREINAQRIHDLSSELLASPIHKTTIRNILDGETDVKLSTIEALSEVLGVESVSLLSEYRSQPNHAEQDDYSAVLSFNLKLLAERLGCGSNASQFAKLINDNAGYDVIDRSYMARIFKHSGVNITVDKIFGIANAVGIPAWKLMHPHGCLQNEAEPNTHDSSILKKAISFSISSAEELCIEEIAFTAEVAAGYYELTMTNQTHKIPVMLAQAAVKFSEYKKGS